MAPQSQASQKMKPLLIAVGVITLIVLLVTQAPSLVRSMQF
jgi:hypothetical protein